MTIGHAFARWKDVCAYEKSLDLDGGASYRAQNMSLSDIRLASVATSIGKSTDKLSMALLNDFDAEADEKEARKSESEQRISMVDQVLKEVAVSKPTDEDVVSNFLCESTTDMHSGGRKGHNSKSDRIKSSCALTSIRNVLPDIQQRRALRHGIEKHFADIVAARAKENERLDLEFKRQQEAELRESPLRKRISDRFGESIEGGFDHCSLGTLAALEHARMINQVPENPSERKLREAKERRESRNKIKSKVGALKRLPR